MGLPSISYPSTDPCNAEKKISINAVIAAKKIFFSLSSSPFKNKPKKLFLSINASSRTPK